MKKEDKRSNEYLKNGNYSFAMMAIIIVSVILVNIIVGKLPDKYTKFDMTATDVFTLSDTTIDILKNVDKDITVYTISEVGNENSYVQNYIELYKNESKYIKSDTINPILDPHLVEKYSLNVSEGSVLLVCGEDFRVIDIDDMFVTTIDSSTTEKNITGMDIEGLVTSAIVRLTTSSTPKVYQLFGNSSSKLSDEQISAINKENVDVLECSFEEDETIPQDADMIIINQPTKDYTDKQAEEILDFMKLGKRALIIASTTDISIENRPVNFEKILAYYGTELEYSTVLESKSDNFLSDTAYYSIAQVIDHSITKDTIKNERKIALYLADSIKLLPENSDKDLTIDLILQSSSSAYLKEQGAKTMAQLPSDETGTFTYAVAVTDNITKTPSKAVIYSSAALTNEKINGQINNANIKLIVSSVRWLADRKTDESIAVKALYPSNLVVSQKQINVYTIFLVVIVPVCILIYGLYVWFRRRLR